MLNKPIQNISIADFQGLIENQIAESKTIEYKRDLTIGKDAERKEFLADISAFANAVGGDLIFGISEEKGLPCKLDGVEITNKDELIRTINDLIRNGIAPRIAGLHIDAWQIIGNRYVLLIRIIKSWGTPHQVIYAGTDKFYMRATNGKYKMDINQLREAFLLSGAAVERIKKFREDRITKIVAGEFPVPLLPYGKLVLHFIPLSSLETGSLIDLRKNSDQRLEDVAPLGGGNRDYIYNLEGIVGYSTPPGQKEHNAYIQFYRNGIIETVDSEIGMPYEMNGHKFNLPSYPNGTDFESRVVRVYQECISLYKRMAIQAPMIALITLVDMQEYVLVSPKIGHSSFGKQKLMRKIAELPEIVIEDLDQDSKMLRKWFDIIWNAFGYSRSLNYTDTGVRI